MEKNEIEELIARKVAEAKLDVTEKRLKYILWLAGAMLALFGVIWPSLQTNRASDKVDIELKQMRSELNETARDLRADSSASKDSLLRATEAIRVDNRAEMDKQSRQLDNAGARVDSAIKDMQKQFKELAGAQIRKPVLECFVGGSSLEGAVLKFSPDDNNNYSATVNIKNLGDAPANNILVHIYSSNIPDNFEIQGWFKLASDEPTYTQLFENNNYRPFSLDPKESQTIKFDAFTGGQKIKPGIYPALLKVYYGQPEPRKYSFTISVSDK